MKIGNQEFLDRGHTYVWGILNITPDSFSDGGKYVQREAALKRVEEMIEEGADILDIGGESTRPGFTHISQEEEIERVIPIIEAIKCRFSIPISLDTIHSKVAQAGIVAGADLINDIGGLCDEAMARLVAQTGVAYCLVHHKPSFEKEHGIAQLVKDLLESVALAHQSGIAKEKIILDPGIGFAKTQQQNLAIIKQIDQLTKLDYPILLGASRKSVIGYALDLPVTQRVEGTLGTTTWAVMKGCTHVRVHDVKENVRVIRMLQAILDSD
ncbi:MAG: dihydropteroate synthase [Lachnospiraceae bacterium]|jgi:dihydropteroate synthase|nr:dihydropteroate synthase [Lachnospiraceae bacterium]